MPWLVPVTTPIRPPRFLFSLILLPPKKQLTFSKINGNIRKSNSFSPHRKHLHFCDTVTVRKVHSSARKFSPVRKIRLFFGASVPIHPRQGPPNHHHSPQTDRNCRLTVSLDETSSLITVKQVLFSAKIYFI